MDDAFKNARENLPKSNMDQASPKARKAWKTMLTSKEEDLEKASKTAPTEEEQATLSLGAKLGSAATLVAGGLALEKDGAIVGGLLLILLLFVVSGYAVATHKKDSKAPNQKSEASKPSKTEDKYKTEILPRGMEMA